MLLSFTLSLTEYLHVQITLLDSTGNREKKNRQFLLLRSLPYSWGNYDKYINCVSELNYWEVTAKKKTAVLWLSRGGGHKHPVFVQVEKGLLGVKEPEISKSFSEH